MNPDPKEAPNRFTRSINRTGQGLEVAWAAANTLTRPRQVQTMGTGRAVLVPTAPRSPILGLNQGKAA
jgi:hypothetical protein